LPIILSLIASNEAYNQIRTINKEYSMINPNKIFVVSYVKQEIGRDIPSKVSKVFKIGQHITIFQLDDYSANEGMITQLENATSINKERIKLLTHKEELMIMGLEL
jgi:hypothetical protein